MSTKRTERRAVDTVRSIYVDLEAIAAWLRVGGANVELTSKEADDKVSRQLVLKTETGLVPLVVPLTPYCHPWTHVSVRDFGQAMEMTKAVITHQPITVFGKRRDDLPSLLNELVSRITQPAGNEGLYSMINRMSSQMNRKFMISGIEESYGPKGTPISTASISLDGTHIGKVVCTGKQYTITCSRQRLIESILKGAPIELCRGILNKCFSLIL